ncbi:MAG: hypothetical protein NTY55_02825 [Flavobacteriia bacterium]|nr:hypothetical protein [Flavobacteriia bacterium]
MKAKLLKKIRSRYTMTFNPNSKEGDYCYKITLMYKKYTDETISEVYRTKEEMFKAYRRSVIFYCGKLYHQYQKNRDKPLQTIKHHER